MTGFAHYVSHWANFGKFCIDLNLINESDNVEAYWRSLPAQLPVWITSWIMSKYVNYLTILLVNNPSRCYRADDIDFKTGNAKDLSIHRSTYASAQKMRASISHKFGRDFKYGMQMWTENPLSPGKYTGNPSLSVTVSQYMISLHRRKVSSEQPECTHNRFTDFPLEYVQVRSGKVVTSARAMDHEMMHALWEFNSNFSQSSERAPRKRKAEDSTDWAGYNVRQMLQALYIVSMLCLLRYNEALRIMWSDIELLKVRNKHVVRLSLPFRKTHQNGGMSYIQSLCGGCSTDN